jgi:hypothetical protein
VSPSHASRKQRAQRRPFARGDLQDRRELALTDQQPLVVGAGIDNPFDTLVAFLAFVARFDDPVAHLPDDPFARTESALNALAPNEICELERLRAGTRRVALACRCGRSDVDGELVRRVPRGADLDVRGAADRTAVCDQRRNEDADARPFNVVARPERPGASGTVERLWSKLRHSPLTVAT